MIDDQPVPSEQELIDRRGRETFAKVYRPPPFLVGELEEEKWGGGIMEVLNTQEKHPLRKEKKSALQISPGAPAVEKGRRL